MEVFKTIEKPEFKDLAELRKFKLVGHDNQNIFVYYGKHLKLVMRGNHPRFGTEIANNVLSDELNNFEMKTCGDFDNIREFYYIYRGYIDGNDCYDILSVDEFNAWLPTRTKDRDYYFHFTYPTAESTIMTETFYP